MYALVEIRCFQWHERIEFPATWPNAMLRYEVADWRRRRPRSLFVTATLLRSIGKVAADLERRASRSLAEPSMRAEKCESKWCSREV